MYVLSFVGPLCHSFIRAIFFLFQFLWVLKTKRETILGKATFERVANDDDDDDDEEIRVATCILHFFIFFFMHNFNSPNTKNRILFFPLGL